MMQRQYKKLLILFGVLMCMLSNRGVHAASLVEQMGDSVYISQAIGNPMVVVGMNSEKAKIENKAYQYISMDIKQDDDLEAIFMPARSNQIKGIQLNVLVEEQIDQDYWEEVGSLSVALGKAVYFNFQTEAEDLENQVKALREVLEASTKDKGLNTINFVYTVKNLQQVAQLLGQGQTHFNINLQQKEDIILLEEIYKIYQNQVKVTVTDDILKNTEMSDQDKVYLVNKFYYELPMKYPNVESIYQEDSPYFYSQAIKNVYSRALAQSWMGLEKHFEKGTAYTQVDYITNIGDQPMQVVITEENEAIEYVDYKINGEFIGRRSAYPYAIQVDMNTLYKGNNEFKIIVKYKGNDELDVKCSYLKRSSDLAVQERESRTTPEYSIDQKMVYKTGYIPVLMYHMFKDVVEKTEYDQSISVSTKLFEQHIQKLNKEGYTPITFLDYKNYLEGTGGLPAKPYIITADDGYLDNYTHAFPILKKYKVPATFFITTQYVGVPTNFDHFTWEQAREMEASGLVDIQSHSNGHILLDKVDKEVVNYEVNRSLGEIEKHLGKRDVKVLAYPQFKHTYDTQQWVREFGVDLQMTNLIREGEPSTPVNIKRIHVHNQMSTNDLIKEIRRVTE